MKVAFDSTFLTIVFDPNTKASVNCAPERIDGLIDKLSSKKDKIIIPTPVLAEILALISHSGPLYIDIMKRYSCFQVRPFDEKSAIEFGIAMRAKKLAERKANLKNISRNKVKFDHQIVCIAKAHGAKIMYSDDDGLRKFAQECGMEAVGLTAIEIPPKQVDLFTESL